MISRNSLGIYQRGVQLGECLDPPLPDFGRTLDPVAGAKLIYRVELLRTVDLLILSDPSSSTNWYTVGSVSTRPFL